MKNYFQILQIAEHPCIDHSLLQQNYFALQQQNHPDKSLDNHDLSSDINEAYAVLNNQFLCACHWLALRGINILSDDCKVKPTIDILQQIFTLQNSINKQNKSEIAIEIKQQLAVANKQIATLHQEASLVDFALHLIKMQYLQKTLQNINNL